MLILEVKSTAAVTRSFKTSKGADLTVSEQEAWADLPNGERRKVKLTLWDGAAPHAPGKYSVGAESFTVNQFGSLELGRLQLVPVK